jgi:hypothetical protein
MPAFSSVLLSVRGVNSVGEGCHIHDNQSVSHRPQAGVALPVRASSVGTPTAFLGVAYEVNLRPFATRHTTGNTRATESRRVWMFHAEALETQVTYSQHCIGRTMVHSMLPDPKAD